MEQKQLLIFPYLDDPLSSQLGKAVYDIFCGMLRWRIWLLLGWQDVCLRYRRSRLGPFWITLSMAIMVYSMGLMYSMLFKMDLSLYYPYIASGILIWTLISTLILDMVNALTESRHFILQMRLPYSVYFLRIIARNYIILAHNFFAVVPILIYYRLSIQIFSFCFGLLLLGMISFFVGGILAILGSRFRDIKQIVASVLQLIFLVTPIMWMPNMLPARYAFFIKFNPLYHLIDIVRSPLIGQGPSLYALKIVCGLIGISCICMIYLFYRSRSRIPFWV